MSAQTSRMEMQRFVAATKEKAKAQVEHWKRKVEMADENAKHLGLEVLAAVEIGALAFGFGWIRGYYGEKKFLGLPIEGWAAIACHAVGLYFDFTAGGGKEGEWDRLIGRQFHNLGNGALAAWLHTLGASTGAEMKEQKQQGGAAAPVSAGAALPPGASVGALPQGRSDGYSPMSQAEIMRIESLA